MSERRLPPEEVVTYLDDFIAYAGNRLRSQESIEIDVIDVAVIREALRLLREEVEP